MNCTNSDLDQETKLENVRKYREKKLLISRTTCIKYYYLHKILLLNYHLWSCSGLIINEPSRKKKNRLLRASLQSHLRLTIIAYKHKFRNYY